MIFNVELVTKTLSVRVAASILTGIVTLELDMFTLNVTPLETFCIFTFREVFVTLTLREAFVTLTFNEAFVTFTFNVTLLDEMFTLRVVLCDAMFTFIVTLDCTATFRLPLASTGDVIDTFRVADEPEMFTLSVELVTFTFNVTLLDEMFTFNVVDWDEMFTFTVPLTVTVREELVTFTFSDVLVTFTLSEVLVTLTFSVVDCDEMFTLSVTELDAMFTFRVDSDCAAISTFKLPMLCAAISTFSEAINWPTIVTGKEKSGRPAGPSNPNS